MQSTCRAFWKMIMDRECHTIVMLGHLNENGRVNSTHFLFNCCNLIIIIISMVTCIFQEVCYQYWPSTADVQMIGEYFVGLQNETPYNGYIERILCVHNKKVKINIIIWFVTYVCLYSFQTFQNLTVTQYQITDWDFNGYTQNYKNIITIMEEMHKVQRKVGTSPILVHCRFDYLKGSWFSKYTKLQIEILNWQLYSILYNTLLC